VFYNVDLKLSTDYAVTVYEHTGGVATTWYILRDFLVRRALEHLFTSGNTDSNITGDIQLTWSSKLASAILCLSFQLELLPSMEQ
jgi:hypothetical protein